MCEATTDLIDTLRPTPKMNLLPTTSKTTADSITTFYVEPMEEDQVKTPRLYILIPLLILVFLIAVSSLFICCQRGMRKRRCSRHNEQLALSGVSDENIKRNDFGDPVQSAVENHFGNQTYTLNAADIQGSGEESEAANEYHISSNIGEDSKVQHNPVYNVLDITCTPTCDGECCVPHDEKKNQGPAFYAYAILPAGLPNE
ncbi:uncharacterized protein LOC117106410 [Anneissia japonica]|uniref:uncharacterized protein LOC117106410 n=1 Tax=Anneissia japonica TaxID=1529436 RepID=UPI0014255F13|nr:uncharacterized protein LOC117106410 [Anneissia japonica]